jgi:hypothetical protein
MASYRKNIFFVKYEIKVFGGKQGGIVIATALKFQLRY